MSIDITPFTNVLGTTGIGFIPAGIIAVLVCIMLAIFITKGKNKQKAIISLAPISVLMVSLGFDMHILFVIFAMALFGIYNFMNPEFEKQIIESN